MTLEDRESWLAASVPVDDGRRDPLDPPKRPRAAVVVRVLSQNTMEFTGSDRAVIDACRQVGARFMRAPRGGAWLVRGDLADDVIALLEDRGFRIEAVL